MRATADPLALEPLGPMCPIADAYPPSDPLALDTGASDSEDTNERLTT